MHKWTTIFQWQFSVSVNFNENTLCNTYSYALVFVSKDLPEIRVINKKQFYY